VVAPKVTGLTLNAALFMCFIGRAKFALEPPMRAERDKARGFLATMPAQDFLDCRPQIVIPQQAEYSAIV
jgi:hypothetical protein